MIPVAKLIEELQKFPPGALARGFEGVSDGVVVVAPNKNAYGGRDQLGCIRCDATDSADVPPRSPAVRATATQGAALPKRSSREQSGRRLQLNNPRPIPRGLQPGYLALLASAARRRFAPLRQLWLTF